MKNFSGFSLIEMAIVLLIVGLLIGGLLTPLSAQMDAIKVKEAKNSLENIKEALLGFVLINRRFPCPARQDSNGEEVVEGGNPLGGKCTLSDGVTPSQHGFVPARTLGLSGSINEAGLLEDPWNNPFRYSVANSDRASGDCSDGDNGEWDFTTEGEMARVKFNCLNPNLQVCTDASCLACNDNVINCPSCRVKVICPIPSKGQVIATSAAVVIFSMGKNWVDTNTSPTSANEVENIDDADNIFVLAERTGSSNELSDKRFDDLLTWISPNIVYHRMVAAGLYP